MIEKQVETIVLSAHFQGKLAADEAESFPEFEDQRRQTIGETAFQNPVQQPVAQLPDRCWLQRRHSYIRDCGLIIWTSPENCRISCDWTPLIS
jgi:hypothetical protein